MPRALVVDDKQAVLDYVGEILEHSLEHQFEVAGNNEDARKLLATKDFDYVLLDLRIPASSRGGDARIQNGVSLFQQILKIKGVGKLAIIIMTSHAAEALNFAGDFQNDGLTFFLAKDLWATAKTVEDAVTEAMSGLDARRAHGSPGRVAQPGSNPTGRRAANRASVSGRAPAATVSQASQWAAVPNEPITVDAFMAKFCEHRSKELRAFRKRVLLAAARHKTITLPPLALTTKSGQANRYFTHDLLRAWPGFLNEGVDVPPLLPQYIADGAA